MRISILDKSYLLSMEKIPAYGPISLIETFQHTRYVAVLSDWPSTILSD